MLKREGSINVRQIFSEIDYLVALLAFQSLSHSRTSIGSFTIGEKQPEVHTGRIYGQKL